MCHERKTRSCSGVMVSATLGLVLFSAQPMAQPSSSPAAGLSKATAIDAKAGSAAEMLAAETKLEEATTKGDTAYFDNAVADDMLFVHRIGWATGGKPRTDDKTSYRKRITDKLYLLNEIDPSAFKVELHGDVAITYGRYISMFWPRPDEMASISSIWYERVWAKRGGRWIFLSHRTVHGPSLAPAGVDRTLGTADTKVWYLTDPAPAAAAARSLDEAELLKIDQKYAAVFTKGDTDSAAEGIPADFVMVNDDAWTRGQNPLSVDTRETLLKRVTARYYDALDFDHVQVEMHGDVAVTTGRYLAHTTVGDKTDPAWSAAWFVRVYEKRNGQWIWLSHRTVHGPTYGASREAVSDK
jgi:hypothetical protein